MTYKNSARRIALTGILTTLALVMFVLEAQLPVIPIYGVKLGLANIMTLAAIRLVGRREALALVLVRVTLGSVYAGTVTTFLFSLAGGLLAWAVMAALDGRFDDGQVWVLSVFGALAHNVGQLAAACAVLQTTAALAYLPVLLIAGIATGLFTGFAATGALKSPVRRFSLRGKKSGR
ncbi:MAG: Gx transporter family protein [Oscillospiraceae bacterium]